MNGSAPYSSDTGFHIFDVMNLSPNFSRESALCSHSSHTSRTVIAMIRQRKEQGETIGQLIAAEPAFRDGSGLRNGGG